jgi:hypothetical protein
MRDLCPRPLALRAVLSLFLIALFALAGTANATRGRAVVSGGTLLSDVGTPLRGLRYSLDYYTPSNPPPDITSVVAGLPAVASTRSTSMPRPLKKGSPRATTASICRIWST